jgi:hypothetical protein
MIESIAADAAHRSRKMGNSPAKWADEADFHRRAAFRLASASDSSPVHGLHFAGKGRSARKLHASFEGNKNAGALWLRHHIDILFRPASIG